MKVILAIASLSFWFGTIWTLDCGDGNLYVNEKQTQYDPRFESYSKIDDKPKLKEATADLEKIIESNLKLSNEAKASVFRLNYVFTVTCEGKIKYIKTLGDTKMSSWTNIDEIIKSTDGMWIPAIKDGKPVDCIYFSKKTIVGGKY